MSKTTKARLFSLLLLLGVLTGVLATPDSQSAYAAICCEHCPSIFDNCMAAPGYGPCYGNYWCCADQAERCTWTCVYC